MTGGSDTALFSAVSVTKLEAAGLDADYAVSVGVRPVSSSADLPPELAGNPYAEPTPGMLFPWHTTEGEVVWQYRPDSPVDNDDGKPVKYVFPTGEYQNFARVRDASAPGGAVVSLVVEGTLQSLAAARYAEHDVAVYAIPGCWGWSEQQVPTADLAVLAGTSVVISLDADAGTNRAVYDAGKRLSTAVVTMAGVEPTFTRLGAGGSAGLDDVLGKVGPDHRAAVVANLITGSAGKKRPADNQSGLKGPGRRSDVLGQATNAVGFDPNDTALATGWADEHRDRFRWLNITPGTWLRYRAGWWAAGTKASAYDSVARYLNTISQKIRAAAEEADEDTASDLKDTARMLLAHRKTSEVLSRAAGHSDLHVERDDIDAHPRLWAAGNGTISLLDREFGPHDPELLLTVGSDVIYDPEATCPRFDRFLAEILPDPEVRGYVLRLFGVAMLGEVRADAQVFTVFVGSGRNGKGALIRTMERLFGDMAVILDPRTLQERAREEHTQEVAKLRGMRLATAQEPEHGKPWNTGRIKSWTGGDRLTGRLMGQNDDKKGFVPSHTLVVTANDRPPVPRSDSAFWMRYREVPFDVSVEGREDPTLERDIADHELPGVLNRCLEGLADYLDRGLAEPAAVVLATHEAQAESDHLAVFVDTHLVHTGHEEDRLLTSEVYDACRKWWAQNVIGQRMPADRGRNNFTSQMQRVLGIAEAEQNPRKAKLDGSIRLSWHGLRWLNGGVADIAPLPGSDIGNPAETATDEEGHPNSEVADIDPEVADTETMSATKLINESPGHSTSVAEVAEVADIPGGSTTHGGKVSGGGLLASKGGRDNFFPHVVHALSPISANRQPAPSGPPVVFDLETGSADQLHDVADPRSYVRIAGVRAHGATVVHAGPDAVIDHVLSSRRVIGHNIVHFDLPALARVDERIDLLGMARAGRLHDTMITESVLHPILNDKRPNAVGRAQKHFGLDAVAARRGLAGKTDEIARLAVEHGGFDRIPLDDPEYRSYCAGDTEATHQLAGHQALEIARLPQLQRDYIAREHRVHAIAATMSRAGFAVDQTLLQRRFWAAYGRKNDLSRSLIAEYGIPTLKADGKPADSPAATKGGKEALLRAFHGLGVALSDIPKTQKGKASFGKDAMAELAELYAGAPNAEAITALAEMCADVAGVRSVYGTILQHLHPDGRVHPSVATYQASGRWSVRDPGLTVLGKRGGKVIERAVLTATDAEHALFAIDLSQIDSRAIAVHSQDHAYLDLFEPGQDAHEIVARMVWGDAAYDATPKILRERVKAITHGLPYGMGLPKLVATTKVPEAEAQRVVDTMNTRFPRLQEWKEEVREQAASGSGLDNGFGRIMLADPERAYTQGPALAGQGTARDLMMECLLRLPDEVAGMLRAQVHDEAVFEVPRARAGEIIEVVNAAFTFSWAPPGASRPVQVVGEAGRLASSWTGCY